MINKVETYFMILIYTVEKRYIKWTERIVEENHPKRPGTSKTNRT
jgi:hypothetical protein